MARPTHAAINNYWGLHVDEYSGASVYALMGYLCRDRVGLDEYSDVSNAPRARTHVVNVDIDDAGDTLQVLHKYGRMGGIVANTITGAKDRTFEELTDYPGYPVLDVARDGVTSLEDVELGEGWFACDCTGVTGSEDVVVYSIYGYSAQDDSFDNTSRYEDANRSTLKQYTPYAPISAWLMQRVCADCVNLMGYMLSDVCTPVFGGATSYDFGT